MNSSALEANPSTPNPKSKSKSARQVALATERAEALNTLHQMAAIVESTDDAIIVKTPEGIIEHWNKGAEGIYGYTAAEMVGQPIEMLVAEDQLEEMRANSEKIKAGGKVDHFETIHVSKDGKRINVSLTISPIADADGKLTHFVDVRDDITDRVVALHEAERQHAVIQESERKLSSLIGNLSGAAFRYLIEDNWTMNFISDGCLDLCGYSATEIVNSNPVWTELVHPSDVLRVAKVVRESITICKPYHVEYRIHHRNGEERWVCEQGRAVFVDDRPVSVEGILTDITEAKKNREKLLQSERLAIMGKMISSIAHESRNALQRIQAGVDMLKLDIPDDSVAGRDLSQIGKARADLQTLLDGLRDFAAPVVLDWQRCNLADVWQQSWRNLDCLKADRQVELVEQTQGVDLHCAVDSFRIEQIFRNLIENSFAACPDSVQITISCSDSELDSVPAVSISVRDNGPGLTQEQQDRIFEAFYTTKPKGTGLGMAIALKTIQAHHGTLVAGNGNGGGAEFVITLPREQL